MRITRLFWRPALAAVAVAGALGCESTTSPGPVDLDSAPGDLDAVDGGYDTDRESPGFGDEYLLSGEAEASIDDAVAADPEVRAMLDDPRYSVWAVRVTWGYIERGDDAEMIAPVDWSGSASIEDGVLLGVRAISFERRQRDYVLGPRVTRDDIEWRSRTTSGFDGIQLLVVDPDESDVDNSITIDMPLFTESFPLPLPADELDATFPAGPDGHEVRVHIVRRSPEGDCARGWVSGRWQNNENTAVTDGRGNGTFVAQLSDIMGGPLASMAGVYGTNEEGRRVMFGKVIDEDGNFRALVNGTWSPSNEIAGVGTFRARIVDADRVTLGELRGVYQHRRDGAGILHGSWRQNCETPDDGGDDGDDDDEDENPDVGS